MHPDGKCHLCLHLQVPTPKRIGTARRRPDQDGLQLDNYITMLPVPSAPQAWMQMCTDIAKHGAAACDAWMHASPCDLPDIQGSSGERCHMLILGLLHQVLVVPCLDRRLIPPPSSS
jgi:hypothetical protein